VPYPDRAKEQGLVFFACSAGFLPSAILTFGERHQHMVNHRSYKHNLKMTMTQGWSVELQLEKKLFSGLSFTAA